MLEQTVCLPPSQRLCWPPNTGPHPAHRSPAHRLRTGGNLRCMGAGVRVKKLGGFIPVKVRLLCCCCCCCTLLTVLSNLLRCAASCPEQLPPAHCRVFTACLPQTYLFTAGVFGGSLRRWHGRQGRRRKTRRRRLCRGHGAAGRRLHAGAAGGEGAACVCCAHVLPRAAVLCTNSEQLGHCEWRLGGWVLWQAWWAPVGLDRCSGPRWQSMCTGNVQVFSRLPHPHNIPPRSPHFAADAPGPQRHGQSVFRCAG